MEALGIWQVIGVTAREIPDEQFLDGYPVIHPNTLRELHFDYILLMTNGFEREMLKEIPEKFGIHISYLIPYAVKEIPGVTILKYLKVRESGITIFSNNCWGGIAYHHLFLENRSPLKNLWTTDQDYLKFIEDPEKYLSHRPVFHSWKEEMGESGK